MGNTPSKSEDHATTCCHDTEDSQNQANQRKPVSCEHFLYHSVYLVTFGYTYINRQMAPALFLVASYRIWSNGPAAEVVTESILPATKSKTMRKMNPVKVPMPTHETIIFGPSTDALGTSGRISLLIRQAAF